MSKEEDARYWHEKAVKKILKDGRLSYTGNKNLLMLIEVFKKAKNHLNTEDDYGHKRSGVILILKVRCMSTLSVILR